MACLTSNMGHGSVIQKNVTITSDVFLLQLLLNSVLQRCNKAAKFKLKLLEIKKCGIAYPEVQFVILSHSLINKRILSN